MIECRVRRNGRAGRAGPRSEMDNFFKCVVPQKDQHNIT